MCFWFCGRNGTPLKVLGSPQHYRIEVFKGGPQLCAHYGERHTANISPVTTIACVISKTLTETFCVTFPFERCVTVGSNCYGYAWRDCCGGGIRIGWEAEVRIGLESVDSSDFGSLWFRFWFRFGFSLVLGEFKGSGSDWILIKMIIEVN